MVRQIKMTKVTGRYGRKIVLVKNITIIGVGLIGGSFGMCCKKNNIARKIIGAGRNKDHLEKAVELKAIDSYSLDLKEAVKDADLILLGTSVKVMPAIVREILPYVKKGAIITDAGSVKNTLLQKIKNLLPPEIYFIGAHPLAGKELSGITAAESNLFFGAKCLITPTKKSNQKALNKVAEIWKSCGAKPIFMEPKIHDQVVALISHLPHLAAYALVNTAGDMLKNNSKYISLSGGGFKDITRVASSNPEMWKDISLDNRENLLKALSGYQKYLKKLENYLKKDNGEKLVGEFTRAKKIRDGI